MDQLRNAGFTPAYVPDSVDTTTFCPTPRLQSSDGALLDARTWYGIPRHAWLIGVVGVNGDRTRDRKNFGVIAQAVAELQRQQDDVFLYLHTDLTGGPRSIDLWELLNAAGVDSDRVLSTNPAVYRRGFSSRQLAALYSSFDVLLAPSAGEGFGRPVIEAQACGTPVIVSRNTSQPELVANGQIVDGELQWDVEQNAWLFRPYVEAVVNALRHARILGSKNRASGREHAERYDVERVVDDYWLPFLSDFLPANARAAPEPNGSTVDERRSHT